MNHVRPHSLIALFVQRFNGWFNRNALTHFWRECGLVLLLYTVLSVVISWPTVRHFTTHIVSDGGDARHNVWVFWHVQQWALGNEPLFETSLLYYPKGISLLVHSMGPAIPLLSLPFWIWGPEAAYNGALLLSLALTGYTIIKKATARAVNTNWYPLVSNVSSNAAPVATAHHTLREGTRA